MTGEAVPAAVVVQGHDLALEYLEQAVGFHLVAPLEVAVGFGGCDRPAVFAVEHLVPPAIEHGEIERPVKGRLLTAGPAGLHGAARVVEPDVAALQQGAGHGDVVVLDEGDPVADRRSPGELDHLADHLLAQVVGRVGFAGENQLDRSLGVQEKRLQAIGLGEQESRPLVRGEPTSETDREDGGVERLVRPGGVHGGCPLFQERRLQVRAHVADQGFLALLARPPELVVPGLGDACPVGRPSVLP